MRRCKPFGEVQHRTVIRRFFERVFSYSFAKRRITELYIAFFIVLHL